MISSPLWQFLALLAVHWVGDFVLQTHWQASNKSKRMDALLRHVSVYTVVLFGGTVLIFGPHLDRPQFDLLIVRFAAINGWLHLLTDYFTSRWSSKLYAKQDWHNFFVVIGFDQLIHQATLAVTMWVIFL